MVLYALLMIGYNLQLFFVSQAQRVDVGTYIGYSASILAITIFIEFIFGILIVAFDIESGFVWGLFTTQFYDYDVDSVKEFISYNIAKVVLACIALITTVLVSTLII